MSGKAELIGIRSGICVGTKLDRVVLEDQLEQLQKHFLVLLSEV